jgi:hypothetical protein
MVLKRVPNRVGGSREVASFELGRRLSLAMLCAMACSDPPNVLTPAEVEAGFVLLFDGVSLAGWRTYREPVPRSQWRVVGGELTLTEAGGGDLITEQQFGDFELRCEWKISEGGNSGIMWRATEAHPHPWVSGPEFQILDSFDKSGHPYQREISKGNIAGSLYDIIPARSEWSKPIGDWNETRIVVRGDSIQLDLNGHLTADVDTTSQSFHTLLASSKFHGWEHFNKAPKGHLVLQDHNDPVAFRSIRIKSF